MRAAIAFFHNVEKLLCFMDGIDKFAVTHWVLLTILFKVRRGQKKIEVFDEKME